ncbi:MAG: hypothetical protein ACK4IS_02545 [Erythrobacter sp.]
MQDKETEQMMRDAGSALRAAVTPLFKDNCEEAGMRAGIDAIESQLGEASVLAPRPAGEAA